MIEKPAKYNLQAKEAYERLADIYGTRVCTYRADIGSYFGAYLQGQNTGLQISYHLLWSVIIPQ